jgi:3-hydroxyacyl-CoA dehydrogenase
MNANPVEHVGLIGAGTMGVGIAYVFAEAGCMVSIVEPDQTRAGDALTTIAARADKLASKPSPKTPSLSGRCWPRPKDASQVCWPPIPAH